MDNKTGENFLPFYQRGKPLNIRTPDEVKKRIINSPDVKEIIA